AVKGARGRKKSNYRLAKNLFMRSGNYAYRDRKNRKRDFRRLWISRINAAVRNYDLSYSKFIYGLGLANINLNRKVLSNMAIEDEAGFKAIVDKAKEAIEAAAK
ncbi:MAG: 50S ribosomal protein L20, partial [Spirochaetota bacterium]